MALIVRHAYSVGNAGKRAESPASIELDELGHKQAIMFADSLQEEPNSIVYSPYIRTKLTAQPCMDKFPNANMFELDIHEFTYLNPSKYNNTTHVERQGGRDEYWARMDPWYSDGGEAESFVNVWIRALELRDFIDESPNVVIFTHGLLMKLIIMQTTMSVFKSPTKEAMKSFFNLTTEIKVPNTGKMIAKSGSEFGKISTDHLPEHMITY